MRTSTDETKDGRLYNGFDYRNQAWVVDGCYVPCGHPRSMACGCYGSAHAGELTKPEASDPYRDRFGGKRV